MSARSLALVVSNDAIPATAKTSRHITRALQRNGIGAICRDTRLIRWSIAQLEGENPVRREAYETAVVAKWDKFMFDYGIDTVISLDLHWLFTSKLFVDNPKVTNIHSIWFGEPRSYLERVAMFPLAPRSLAELLNGPKVSHHCHGEQRVEELRQFGVERVLPSLPVSPEKFGTDETLWDSYLKGILK